MEVLLKLLEAEETRFRRLRADQHGRIISLPDYVICLPYEKPVLLMNF